MDAYLICPETKKYMWLGKPIRSDGDFVDFYSQNPCRHNHDNPLLNKVLWKFLSEHARKELRIVFSGEFIEDEFEAIWTSDIEAENYLKDWRLSAVKVPGKG